MPLPARIPREPVARRGTVREGNSGKHCDWLRTLPCCNCGHDQCGAVHHLLRADPKRGGSRRAEDRYGIPLCGVCHQGGESLHHDGNELGWLSERGIQGKELADALWRNSGNTPMAYRLLSMYGAIKIRGYGALFERGPK